MRRTGIEGWGIGIGATALVAAAVPSPLAAQAATPAGTVIVNVATARAVEAGGASGQASIIVAERLDAALCDPQVDAAGVRLTLVNPGNGAEAFALVAVLRDAQGDGPALPIVSDAGALAEGRTPPRAPGATLALRVPLDAAALASAASLVVAARALTGSGDPGTAFASRGDGGGDAVVGPTGAAARLVVPLAGAAWQPPTIAIAQAVVNADGSTKPARGAVVTYTVTARFPAATPDGTLADTVPAGTAYRPGTLRLDGEPVADAGRVDGDRIAVPLGTVAAGATRRLSFQVVIS